ncbi:MAG: hypothetical protein ACPGN3_01905 [Opitutales bacterium]
MKEITVYYTSDKGEWLEAGRALLTEAFSFENDDLKINITFEKIEEHIAFDLSLTSKFPTRCKLQGALDGENPWHLIPCCIHGDNNLQDSKPGQYPNLTYAYPEEDFSSPYWEFRSDRASHPVSVLFTDEGSAGISIDNYCTDADGNLIRNGLFSELPNRFGVTLGYENNPYTFINKKSVWAECLSPSTRDAVKSTTVKGRIFTTPEKGIYAAAPMISCLYAAHAERPSFKKSYAEAAQGVFDRFIHKNWSDEFKNYTNQLDEKDGKGLQPWRGLLEIAWTGGTILGYPFLMAEDVLDLPEGYFSGRDSGWDIFDRIADSVNPESGLFYDLAEALNGSRYNGWWSGMKVTHDCHCSYTNGQALYYFFITINYLRKAGKDVPEKWFDAATTVANSFLEIQREDGCCGYTYYTDRKEVKDWSGFAGCWVVAGFAAAFAETGEQKYLEAARKGMDYYRTSVIDCNACGTPMDTWKSPEEEGNLAYVKAARLLHEATSDSAYLEMLEEGAHYEYLWRYGFKAIPEADPLKGTDWNSCGGSITSVSNPHMHPMALIITEDLYYLARHSGNDYHRDRAEDSIAWAMQCLELYPETVQYGEYGVLTERFCPSDGLLIEKFPDGRPSSVWFSYNGWASANVLEALLCVLNRK